MNPNNLDKYLYIQKTPTWLVRSFYAIGLVAWSMVVYGYFGHNLSDMAYRLVAIPIIGFFTIYTFSSFGLNLFYKQFNLTQHFVRLKSYWADRAEPTVDVFLPICGEDIEILDHTWKYVARLKYHRQQVWVLDDSKEGCNKHKDLADHYGFNYFERPNKGEMKKAGNLKYAYERTKGEFIVIFDADFAPHRDFLHDLLPYMGESKVGIVQSPQCFEMTKRISQRSALEYGGANIQECFYRFIQVVRDRFNATVCCGTNAIYRRAALDVIGGTVQAGHSEDQRTGFALQSRGWIVRYVPVILAVGLCPDNIYPYFHQQHRWCTGNIELMLNKEFWTSPVSWRAKFCYITGFLFYFHHLLAVVFSFQLFWWLFFYNQEISLANGFFFYPYLIFTVVYLGFFPIARFHWGVLYALCTRLYSYCHSIVATLLNSSVVWIATGAKQTSVSAAFKQTTIGVALYVLLYASLMALAVRQGLLHVFDYNYYTVEFWLFYNLFFSSILLWQMYRVIEEAELNRAASLEHFSLATWRLKTAGTYSTLAVGLFALVLYLPVRSSSTAGEISSAEAAGSNIAISFIQTAPALSRSFTGDLGLEAEGPDVLALQQFLNTNGFPLRAIGPGSPDNETAFFGHYTYQALVKFQTANGLPATGQLEFLTREIINSRKLATLQ